MTDSPLSPSSFRPDFLWGAATASYQIEGAAREGGRGPSVWDVFCHTPGKTWEGDTGDNACDHYYRWAEDIGLMRELGLKAYRFSLAWPRILPDGEEAVNEQGLEFYDRLVDGLLEAGIEPCPTLFHWDLPLALYQQGGWLNASMPDWFAAYTRVVVDRLSDRVTRWMTLNEPQCFIGLGLDSGRHAPGDRLARPLVLRAAHHALLSHGRAVQVIRERARKPPQVGWAPVGVSAIPASDRAEDIEAARRAMFEQRHIDKIVNPYDTSCLWSNTWWGDPVIFGRYPEDSLAHFGADVPPHTDAEMAVISSPLDFYGLNIYNGITVRATGDGEIGWVDRTPGAPRTHLQWSVSPSALYWGPKLIQERYQLPIIITENGVACHDWVGLDGKVHDPQRIDFTQRYLRELHRAAGDGVDLRGYFHWSLMDNFEWAEGFRYRLGLIHVDYQSFARTLKDSARWYRRVIETNGASLAETGG